MGVGWGLSGVTPRMGILRCEAGETIDAVADTFGQLNAALRKILGVQCTTIARSVL